MQLHSRCHQFCDVLPPRGRTQFLSRPRNVAVVWRIRAPYASRLQYRHPSARQTISCSVGERRLRSGKVSRSVETITRFLHDFANFNEKKKKKKKERLRSFLRKRDSFGDKNPRSMIAIFTIHTANREAVFPRKTDCSTSNEISSRAVRSILDCSIRLSPSLGYTPVSNLNASDRSIVRIETGYFVDDKKRQYRCGSIRFYNY